MKRRNATAAPDDALVTDLMEEEITAEPEFTVLKKPKVSKRRVVNPGMKISIGDAVVSGGEALVDFSATEERNSRLAVERHNEEIRKQEEGWEVPPMDPGLKRVGELSPNKGEVAGQAFWSWDTVRDCEVTCPLHDRCQYAKREVLKCRIQSDYMKYVTRVVTAQMKVLPATDRMKIGFHLLPLYGQLVLFKIQASTADPVYMDDKGNYKIHPVFKEIRNIIAVISQVWSTVAIDPMVKRNFKKNMEPEEFLEGSATYEDVCGAEDPGDSSSGE